MLTTRIAWRAPELGEMRELDLPQGTMRCYERGVGEPLVFVHGMMQNANYWRLVIDQLAPDFRCISLDLPLGGHLVAMPRADLTFPGLARLIVEAVHACGLERATLIANDSGTCACQVLAARDPEVADALVLTSGDFRENSPPPFWRFVPLISKVPGGTLMWLGPALLPIRALDRLPFGYGWFAKRKQETRAVVTYFQPIILDRGIRRDYERFARNYKNRYAIEAAVGLPDFDRPVLLAWSREDKFFPAATAEELARLLPNARLEWIDDAYTYSAEDQPDRLVELIAAFMRSRATVVG